MADEFSIARGVRDAADFETGRVARERAFKERMQGTFQQNADLKRQVEGTWQDRDNSAKTIQGTFDKRNQAAVDLQRDNNDAQNWRTITTDQTTRRGQDLGMQESTMRNSTALRGQDLAADSSLQQNITARRGHDVHERIGGWNYPVIKQYDANGQVISEGVVAHHFGKPVNQQGQQGALDPRFKALTVDQHYADWINTQSPEMQAEHANQLKLNGNTAALKFMADDQKRRVAGQNQAPGAAPATGKSSGFQAPGIEAMGPAGTGLSIMRAATLAFTADTPSAPQNFTPPAAGATGDLFPGGAPPEKNTGLWRRDRTAIDPTLDVFGASPPPTSRTPRKKIPYPGQRVTGQIPTKNQ